MTLDAVHTLTAEITDSADKLRREAVKRVRSLYGDRPLQELDYGLCLMPALKAVLSEWEEQGPTQPPLQQYATEAALLLWLWFDQRCALFAARVRQAGGLLVVGTSVQESKRIELQLRGRAGRQGDAGEASATLT